jgi:hypothetical protein
MDCVAMLPATLNVSDRFLQIKQHYRLSGEDTSEAIGLRYQALALRNAFSNH